MPHSLRVRLKNLNYKGLLTDRELNRLVNALDTVDSIRAEVIEWLGEAPCYVPNYEAYDRFLKTIDKYTKGEAE